MLVQTPFRSLKAVATVVGVQTLAPPFTLRQSCPDMSATPLHRMIAEELREQIRGGALPPGAPVPSESELVARYGVARGTVRQALAALRAEGVITVRRGARAVVLAQPRAQTFSELLSFTAWARAVGDEPAGRVVSLRREYADGDDVLHLDLRPGEPVFRLVRVRLLGERPVMVERTTFVDAIGRRVAALDLEHRSIYEQLELDGIVFANARHVVSAIAADDEDAALLAIEPGTPLLRQLRRTTAPDGSPLEWSDDRYRGDAVSFLVENSAATRHSGRVIDWGAPR